MCVCVCFMKEKKRFCQRGLKVQIKFESSKWGLDYGMHNNFREGKGLEWDGMWGGEWWLGIMWLVSNLHKTRLRNVFFGWRHTTVRMLGQRHAIHVHALYRMLNVRFESFRARKNCCVIDVQCLHESLHTSEWNVYEVNCTDIEKMTSLIDTIWHIA